MIEHWSLAMRSKYIIGALLFNYVGKNRNGKHLLNETSAQSAQYLKIWVHSRILAVVVIVVV